MYATMVQSVSISSGDLTVYVVLDILANSVKKISMSAIQIRARMMGFV
jgi:hypothetical protein